MRVEIRLPELGEDAEEKASVSRWLVNIGDIVNTGDDLIELTTDKAAFTVPSPQNGVVVELLVEEGDDVVAGDPLCIVES